VVAVGARNDSDSAIHSHRLHRLVMGRTFNLLANALTDVQLKDTQCGFKAFRTPMARILFHLTMTDRFAFDVEVLSLARQLGLQIAEIPVEWREAGNSTVRPFTDSLSMALDVCRIRWRSRRPRIPALEVGSTNVSAVGHDRSRSLFDATSVFRKTDPIISLSQKRAIVLLPLCETDEIDGAAHRLSRTANGLTVRKCLISCGELADMLPGSLDLDANRPSDDGPVEIPVLKDRRRVGHAGEGPYYPQADLEPLSRLEV
jgi:hypothetical protein